MSEQKKTLGRSRIYTGGQSEENSAGDYAETPARPSQRTAARMPVYSAQGTVEEESGRPAARTSAESPERQADRENLLSEDRRSHRAQTIGTAPRERLMEQPSSRRRRRDEETEFRMRVLWILLGILIVLLAAAIFFEVVLGYGSLETGSERMGAAAEQTETLAQTEGESEQETETSSAEMIGDTAGVPDDTSSGEAAEDASGTADGSAAGEASGTADDGFPGDSSGVSEDSSDNEDTQSSGTDGGTLAGVGS